MIRWTKIFLGLAEEILSKVEKHDVWRAARAHETLVTEAAALHSSNVAAIDKRLAHLLVMCARACAYTKGSRGNKYCNTELSGFQTETHCNIL